MLLLNHFRQIYSKINLVYQIKLSEWDRNIWDFVNPSMIIVIVDLDEDVEEQIKVISEEVRGAMIIVKTSQEKNYNKIKALNLVNTKTVFIKRNNREEQFASYSYPLSLIKSNGFISNLEGTDEVYYFMDYLGNFINPNLT